MAEAIRTRFEPPKISNAKDFLEKTPQHLEVGKLKKPPSMKFLKWLPTARGEISLVLQKSEWYIIKASVMGVPSALPPLSSDVILHSHPLDKEDKHGEGMVPGIRDFVNCSPTAKNLIVSSFGITQYWSVKDEIKWKDLRTELLLSFPRFNSKKNFPAYLEFLKNNDARYESHPWMRIDESKFKELLSPKV